MKKKKLIAALEKAVDLMISKCGGPGGTMGPCPGGGSSSGSSDKPKRKPAAKKPPAEEGSSKDEDAPRKARVSTPIDDTPAVDHAIRSFAEKANLHWEEDPLTAGGDTFGGWICKKADKPKLDDYLKKLRSHYDGEGDYPEDPKGIGGYRFDHRDVEGGIERTIQAVKDVGGSAKWDDNRGLLTFSWTK